MDVVAQTKFFLTIGTALGGSDIYGAYQGYSLATTIFGLLASGQPVFVRLYWYVVGNPDRWEFVDCEFKS